MTSSILLGNKNENIKIDYGIVNTCYRIFACDHISAKSACYLCGNDTGNDRVRAEWHHEFEDDLVWLDAKYVSEDTLGTVPPGDFTSTACLSCARWSSDEIDTDFGLVGVGVSAVFSRRIQMCFMYDALIGVDNLASNTFSIGLRGQF